MSVLYHPLIIVLLIVSFWMLACGSECDRKGGESCKNVGSLKGLVYMMESVSSAFTNMISSAKHSAETIEDDFCISPKISNCSSITRSSPDDKDSDHCIHAERDCKVLFELGFKESGPYRIWPIFLNHSVIVYCDMETDGGGWTVIQKRGDFEPHVSFFENWITYKNGFGDIRKEFWLGNDVIFALTNQAKVTLRIDLEDFDGQRKYAKYQNFLVRSELENYKMTVGDYEGTAGDAMTLQHNGREFSTIDRGNDCPKEFKGGWWYGACHEANLNGLYHRGDHKSYADGVNWFQFRGHNHSMKVAEMKIRACDC